MIPIPTSGSRKTWIVLGPRKPSASQTRRARSVELGVVEHLALDRLAAAGLEHGARDRVEADPVEVAQAVDGELLAAHGALDHDGLLDVVDEERGLRGVLGQVDGAGARALARLDDDGVAPDRVARQDRRRARQAELEERLVGAVLVEHRRADLRGRDERREPLGARRGEHVDVEVRQRDDRADAVLRAEPLEEGDVARVVDARRRDPEVRGVLRGGERVRVGGDRERVAGERADDVVALPDAGEQDRRGELRPLSHGSARACRSAARGAGWRGR